MGDQSVRRGTPSPFGRATRKRATEIRGVEKGRSRQTGGQMRALVKRRRRSGRRSDARRRRTLAPVAIEAAFFDLDKTIIAKSSVLAFGKPFYREGLLSKRAVVKSIYAQIVFMLVGADEAKMEKLREAMLSLTQGWNQQHIADIVRETLDQVISPIVFAEALELFDQHHAAGRRVVIVSSAPQEVVGPLGEFLGADEVIATRAEIDDDGNYTGEVAFYAYGPFKADAIRRDRRPRIHRPLRLVRVQRLDHRPSDAGGGRSSGRGESGPGARERGAGA